MEKTTPELSSLAVSCTKTLTSTRFHTFICAIVEYLTVSIYNYRFGKWKSVVFCELFVVTRSCAPSVGMKADNECKMTGVAGIEAYFCHCSEDYCNNSHKLTVSSVLLVITAVLAICIC